MVLGQGRATPVLQKVKEGGSECGMLRSECGMLRSECRMLQHA